MNIYKFYSNGLYIVLDINSGAVHVVDEMVYNIVMDIFDGTNDEAVTLAFANQYAEAEIAEVLTELHQLIDDQKLLDNVRSSFNF